MYNGPRLFLPRVGSGGERWEARPCQFRVLAGISGALLFICDNDGLVDVTQQLGKSNATIC